MSRTLGNSMKRWIQFILLWLAASAFGYAPNTYVGRIVSDARGNLLVVNDAHHGGVVWNKSRPTGYGAIPGYRPPALGHGASLVECSAMGGRPILSFGGCAIGYRILLADIGQWASADPAGH